MYGAVSTLVFLMKYALLADQRKKKTRLLHTKTDFKLTVESKTKISDKCPKCDTYSYFSLG